MKGKFSVSRLMKIHNNMAWVKYIYTHTLYLLRVRLKNSLVMTKTKFNLTVSGLKWLSEDSH